MRFFLLSRDEMSENEIGWPDIFETAKELLEWAEQIDLENNEFVIISDEPRQYRPVLTGKKWELIAVDPEAADVNRTMEDLLKSIAFMLRTSAQDGPDISESIDAEGLFDRLKTWYEEKKRHSTIR